MPDKIPAFIVYCVEERKGSEKPFFREIGVAWWTESGDGLNVVLQVFPLNGRILLLPYRKTDKTPIAA